ncbi:MAG: 2-oxo-4-hydroxy-4-carboxy-5-ureidoimidazoline decarboxylase [Gordonia sp. (in: high G+C Gram-positive bacteria)]
MLTAMPKENDAPKGLQLDEFNALPPESAAARLTVVCSARRWVDMVCAGRPYATLDDLLAASDDAVAGLSATDLDEALAGHPRIGERSEHAASSAEQAAVLAAGDDFAARMREANQRYETRFSRVYLVAAAGRAPDELLALLEERLGNSPADELAVVRRELAAINRLRLTALLAPAMSVVSTHVLDVSVGRAAAGMGVVLTGPDGEVARGVTDADGRIHDFARVPPGRYTAVFDTGGYFPDGLYPEVAVTLNLPSGKIHLPLLVAPFAYSTYRGT